jgi:hypothetical protein
MSFLIGFIPFGGAAVMMFIPIGTGGFSGKVMYMTVLNRFGSIGGSTVTVGMIVIATGFAFIIVFMARTVRRRFGNPVHHMPVAIID